MMNKFNKQKTINNIVDDFNDNQIHDSYYFEDSGIDITWNSDREVYLILNDNKTFDYAKPSQLISFIENLTKKDLKNYCMEWGQ